MDILTERLRLTPLTLSYLDSACAYALNPENTQMMVFLPNRDKAETEAFIRRAEAEWSKERPEFLEFAVLQGGEHIGGVTLYFEGDFSRGELGWIIRLDCQGKGYAAEAAQGLMDYFHRHWGLNRFIAHCDSENIASRRVMEKLGMRRLGVHGGRYNRLSDEERLEYLYEINL
ncbi:MAG: GNAT family N-acetyltransferase [Ruminococcus sp.]